MNDASPIAAPPARQMVQPSAITIIAEEFGFRRNGIDKAHVRTLAQALRNGGGKLDPILLWREIGPSGETGRLILLDGEHRLAAYLSARKRLPKASKTVPAIILVCDRDEAMCHAAFANRKDTLSLTHNEKSDAAWRMVRFHNATLSKTKIAHASGISPRTVTNMRLRWKALLEAGGEITGQWWRDRKDDQQGDEAAERLTEAERRAEVITLGNALREAAGSWPKRDSTLVAEALQVAFGFNLRGMAEFLYGASERDEDEFFDTPISPLTGTETTTEGDDF
jgi:ParB-like nuclease domain